jgi:hypothetical protein
MPISAVWTESDAARVEIGTTADSDGPAGRHGEFRFLVKRLERVAAHGVDAPDDFLDLLSVRVRQENHDANDGALLKVVGVAHVGVLDARHLFDR